MLDNQDVWRHYSNEPFAHGPTRKHVVNAMKDAGLVSKSTYPPDVNVQRLVNIARAVRRGAMTLSMLAFVLLPALANADPIITLPDNSAIVWTGNAGVVNWTDVHEPIVWTSTAHLRFGCYEQWGANYDPTGDGSRAASCVRQTIMNGLFIYTMDVSSLPCGDRAQGDTELDAGSDIGAWLVVSRTCEDKPPREIPHEPMPVPEPAAVRLLALGLALLWRFGRKCS